MSTNTFDIITEADARLLEPGSTVRLAAKGHVTPLAADTLRQRRVTVLRADGSAADDASLLPVNDIRRVVIGNDHTAIALKRTLLAWLRGRGLSVDDAGTNDAATVDYPDIAAAVATTVARGEADAGIVIDGAGIGSAIAANKIAGIRAAMCMNTTLARYAREHNGTNVLTLGSALVTADEATSIVETWLGTPMREPRYIRRLAKIRALEKPGQPHR
jgi:ribose 5-phosphate isomerase B